jgi:hypothetical protein
MEMTNWKMKARTYGFLILLLALGISNAISTADGPDYWQVHGVERNDVLNIRQEANARSRKIGEIPAGAQCVKNLKCVGGLTFDEFTNLSQAEKDRIIKERPRWCNVEYKGMQGWVAARYLREGGCEVN